MKLYIAVLEDVPDHMVPVLVAHSVLGAHLIFNTDPSYQIWLEKSFKKCVLRVNKKEFSKIKDSCVVYAGHENTTLEGVKSCLVVLPSEEYPNVLKFAKLWQPKKEIS